MYKQMVAEMTTGSSDAAHNLAIKHIQVINHYWNNGRTPNSTEMY